MPRSNAERDRLELGTRLVASLPQIRSQQQVADMLGVSRQAIQRQEKYILAKVAKKLMEIAREH